MSQNRPFISFEDFGAVQGGSDCAAAIMKALQAARGGMLVIPKGDWYAGTIELPCDTHLHLSAGARLICIYNERSLHGFSDDETAALLPVPFFIGAANVDNISISGEGVIDGQGDNSIIFDEADGRFNECPLQFIAFRPKLMLFINVEGLNIRDVTLKNAASWTLHMAGCRRVRIDGIRILNNDRGANNDGIDPDSCQDVRITNCDISTGDDAIVLKATKPMATRFGACSDIYISNCRLHSRDSALKIGTETHADIQHVVMTNCVAYDCSRIVGIWARDGGTIQDVSIANVSGSCRRYADAPSRVPSYWWGKGEPVFLSVAKRSPDALGPGRIENVSVDNLTARCESSLFASGEVVNLQLRGVHLTFVRQGTQPTGIFDEQPAIRDFTPHDIPGIYLNGVRGALIQGCSVAFINGEKEAWTSLLEAHGVEDLHIIGLDGQPAKAGLHPHLIKEERQ